MNIYLRKQESTISKLTALLSCVAFANLDAFAVCFRWPGGSGEQRGLCEGAVPGRGPALHPAWPWGRGALRALPQPGLPAVSGRRWQGLHLDLGTVTYLTLGTVAHLELGAATHLELGAVTHLALGAVTHLALIAFPKSGLTIALQAYSFIARICAIRGIFAQTQH